jgi:hypothetical protein
MKPKPPKAKPTAVREAQSAWPLLAAYLELAERHAALLTQTLQRALADARQAHRNAQIEAQVADTLDEVEAAIMAMPAPKLF